jgi:hypothetical protein
MPRGPLAAAVTVVVIGTAVAGCASGSGSGVTAPKIAPARVFRLSGFEPVRAIPAHRPASIAFTITEPSGKPLTAYKSGAGPHTGVHLIIVRDDLSVIIHRHPPVARDGRVTQAVTFPSPGPYRVLVDAYPRHAGAQPNFQLVHRVNVAGHYRPEPLPRFGATDVVDGYRFHMQRAPHLKAISPAFVTIRVTDPQGRPAGFTPWYGALAHAIFFRRGSLDYFHTHVCGAGATNCASTFGAAKVTGRSTTPGKLTVGVLVPTPGTWRLFLQAKSGGRVLTAPFTLPVR